MSTVLLPQMFVVRFVGQAMVKVGTCVTVTVKAQAFVPQALVAVQVTAVVPRGNTLPLAGEQPASVPPVMAGLANVTAVAPALQEAFVKDAGQVTVMGTVGTGSTVTSKEQ